MKYISTFALIVLVLLVPSASAGPLEEALTIVLAQSEVVQSKQRMTGIVNQGSNLNTKVKVASGYADKSNDEFSGGFQNRAMLSFEYPLTGGVSQTDKEKAQSLSALYEAQENLTKAFVLELQKLAVLKSTYDIKNRNYSFFADMLTKLQKANQAAKKAGKIQDIVDPTIQLDKTLAAENEARLAWMSYNTMHQSVCRIYGKQEWKKLAVHTKAYLKLLAPTPPAINETK